MTIEVVKIDDMLCPAVDVYFRTKYGLRAHTKAAKEALDLAQPYLKARRMAIDVGAHIGTWTRQMLDRFDDVIAFEPEGGNYTLLLENARGAMNLKAFPMALAVKTTRIQLNGDARATACGWVTEGNGELAEPWTMAITLDAMRLPYLDLLKVDVEGLEIDVLEGARVTLEKCRPVVIFEDGNVSVRYGFERGDTKKWLEDLDYHEVGSVEFMQDQHDRVMVPKEFLDASASMPR